MEINLLPHKYYTYADYLKWSDDVGREIYNGQVKLRSPASGRMHQQIVSEVSRLFGRYFKANNRGSVHRVPFAVRLPSDGATCDEEVHTVVLPDVCVVCDPSKIDQHGCIGAPDLVVEIVSQRCAGRYLKEKFEVYQRYGVLEYWIIRPYDRSLEVFLLSENGKYEIGGIYTENDKVPVAIFQNELKVDLADLFTE